MGEHIKKKAAPYAMILNDILNDKELSFKAKGLFAYMASKTESWNFTIKSIRSQTKDGQNAITSALDELKEKGYVYYQKHSDGTGTYHIYENPKLENPHLGFVDMDKPKHQNPDVGYPNLGKSNAISNTILKSNTDLSNIDFTQEQKLFEIDPVTPDEPKKQNTMFKNSEAFDIDYCLKKLDEEVKLGIDIHYYHRAVKNWSDINPKKLRTRDGWIATFRTFISKDNDGKKVKFVNASSSNSMGTDEEMKRYLNMG